MHEVDALRNKIETLKLAVVNTKKLLKEQIEELQSSVKALAMSRASGRYLPSSVLTRIFAASIAFNDEDDSGNELIRRTFLPLNDKAQDDYRKTHIMRTILLLVCSKWNQIILHEPQLWTTVYIDVESAISTPVPDEFKALNDMVKPLGQKVMNMTEKRDFPPAAMDRVLRDVKRAKGLPQRLRVFLPHGFSWVISVGFHPIHVELFKFLPRIPANWESISVRFTDDRDSGHGQVPGFFNPEGVTSEVASRMFSGIHTLDLTMPLDVESDQPEAADLRPEQLIPETRHESHGERTSTTPKFTLTAEMCPNLRRVTMKMAARNLLQWDLPWKQLTDLTLEAFSNPFRDYLEVLRSCESLEKLHIHVQLPNRRFYIVNPRPALGTVPLEVLLPRLHTLTLRADVRCGMLEGLIGKLNVPSLHTFTYVNAFNKDQGERYLSLSVIKWLSILIRQSGCSIRSLSILLYEATIREHPLLEKFFDDVPALESLWLAGQRMTCEFLKRTKLPATLRDVRIHNIGHPDDEAQMNFVEWVDEWVNDERCSGEEGREGDLSATLSTILRPMHKPDPKNEKAIRYVRSLMTLEELQEKGIDVKLNRF
ncbi:hypothetical protein NMY22_g3849 [Coprinellus aureogranulatus]|nr:hypothetical protein NMY22_g3849 [Coprinellus aureogranulatus]